VEPLREMSGQLHRGVARIPHEPRIGSAEPTPVPTATRANTRAWNNLTGSHQKRRSGGRGSVAGQPVCAVPGSALLFAQVRTHRVRALSLRHLRKARFDALLCAAARCRESPDLRGAT
jgi:hypothetical protein